jgi:hypothetical protein
MNSDSRTAAMSILGGSLIVCSLIGGGAFIRSKSLQDRISVTGSAYRDVVSDTAKWRLQITTSTGMGDLAVGNAKVAADLKAVKKFLKDKGIEDAAITVAPVNVETRLDYNTGGTPVGYNLRQEITVEGADVEKIGAAAQEAGALLAQGAVVSTVALEYFIGNLPELRIELMGSAMEDARKRADAIVESVGSSVGPLREASMGVLQVTAQNSMDVSDYGAYDTSALKKRVTAVVRASFAVR